jgi:arsenate reductase-like glutaredoxin family protein
MARASSWAAKWGRADAIRLAMLSVQIFGLKNSPATRAAERFFKERRVAIHRVDLKQKPMAGAEIKRFIERFGLAVLLDSEGRAYIDAGLKYYTEVPLLESTDM